MRGVNFPKGYTRLACDIATTLPAHSLALTLAPHPPSGGSGAKAGWAHAMASRSDGVWGGLAPIMDRAPGLGAEPQKKRPRGERQAGPVVIP